MTSHGDERVAVEAGGVPVLRVGDGLDPIPTNAASHDEDHEGEDRFPSWSPDGEALLVPRGTGSRR